MKLQFYPTDVSYTVANGKPVVQLYGRTTDGRQICVLDENFAPYFYVVGTIAPEELESIASGEYNVTKVEMTRKKLNEKETDALKVFVNIPKGVPAIKDKVKELSGVKNVYEYDILYARRYLIDKRITPLVLTTVECEETAERSRVPCYKAGSIAQESDKVLKHPKILAVDIETYNPDNKLNPRKNPIIMIGLYGKDFQRVITWKQFKADDYVEFVSSEADMLQRFVELVHDYGPDFIVGYNTDGFDFPYIDERAKLHKTRLDLGLDYSGLLIGGKMRKEAKITGISHLDIFRFIIRTIAPTLQTETYSLNDVAGELLGAQKHDVDMDNMFVAWDEGSDELGEFATYNLIDCKLTYELTEKVLPNLIEFVRIIRLSPFDINRMSYSMFVEWYLISQAGNEIIPNRPHKMAEASRMHDRIKGAFVYEPKPGFYTDVMVFDYRSLYPSIIASLNISKGTLNCNCCTEPAIETERGTFVYCAKKKGFFSSIIQDLITRRSDIKKQLKRAKDPLLEARSMALKLLANSFYGYMGFAPARWYCIECAESTTAWARHYIHKTIDGAKHAGFSVLYSDTDSVFLQLGEKTKDDAIQFVQRINKDLPGLMELEFEGYYPAGLFVSIKAGEGGAKKKYALVDEHGNMKIKGFETVRRNWSFIAKDVQLEVLRIILQEHDTEKARQYVKQVVQDLRDNKLPVEKVVIHTALSKGTESYAAIGPHVAAAKRMEAKGETVGKGSIVHYVVGKGKGRIRDKVRLPEEITQDDYDGEYYVQNQIIPGVERIFAVLDISIDEFSNQSKQTSLSGF